MFFKLFAIFAMLAVAFANPKPDVLTYGAASVLPVGYSAYAPVAYASPYAASPYAAAALPYPYSGYYVR